MPDTRVRLHVRTRTEDLGLIQEMNMIDPDGTPTALRSLMHKISATPNTVPLGSTTRTADTPAKSPPTAVDTVERAADPNLFNQIASLSKTDLASADRNPAAVLDDRAKPANVNNPVSSDSAQRAQGITNILGHDPNALPQSYDFEAALKEQLAANQRAVTDAVDATLGKVGVDRGIGAGRGAGAENEADAINTLPSLPKAPSNTRDDGLDLAKHKHAQEARRGIFGNEEEKADGDADAGGNADASNNSGDKKGIDWAAIGQAIVNFFSAVATEILGPLAGPAASIGLATTKEEDAVNVKDGILGVYRSGATGTSNQHAADQLKKSEQLKQPGIDRGTVVISEREWKAMRGGTVDPVDGETIDAEVAAAKIGQGAAIHILSTINPNPEGTPNSDPPPPKRPQGVDPVDPDVPGAHVPKVRRPDPVPVIPGGGGGVRRFG
jgi:hypothetical protein